MPRDQRVRWIVIATVAIVLVGVAAWSTRRPSPPYPSEVESLAHEALQLCDLATPGQGTRGPGVAADIGPDVWLEYNLENGVFDRAQRLSDEATYDLMELGGSRHAANVVNRLTTAIGELESGMDRVWDTIADGQWNAYVRAVAYTELACGKIVVLSEVIRTPLG